MLIYIAILEKRNIATDLYLGWAKEVRSLRRQSYWIQKSRGLLRERGER